MLCSLMELVEYDAEAIAKLVVVGVLQGGTCGFSMVAPFVYRGLAQGTNGRE